MCVVYSRNYGTFQNVLQYWSHARHMHMYCTYTCTQYACSPITKHAIHFPSMASPLSTLFIQATSLYPSVCVSHSLSLSPSLCLSPSLFFSLFLSLTFSLSVCLSLFVCLSVSLYLFSLSVSFCMSLSVSLSVCASQYLCFYFLSLSLSLSLSPPSLFLSLSFILFHPSAFQTHMQHKHTHTHTHTPFLCAEVQIAVGGFVWLALLSLSVHFSPQTVHLDSGHKTKPKTHLLRK